MIRATTPRHIFVFDSDPSDYARILITYVQGDSIVMEKHKEDLSFEPTANPCTGDEEWAAYYRLTQEETKRFQANPGKPVKVQIRVLTTSGESLASDKKTITVQDVLNDEVLV